MLIAIAMLLVALLLWIRDAARSNKGRSPEWSFDLLFWLNREVDGRLVVGCQSVFDGMIRLIEGARRSVCLEMYIVEDDYVGRRFERALVERAAEGVDVRVLCDGYGCRAARRTILRRMARGGVKVLFYPPLLTRCLDARNHRKLLVVDGFEGYVGGVNIARRYVEGWRDVALYLRGDDVTHIAGLFEEDWCAAQGQRVERALIRASLGSQLFTERELRHLYCELLEHASSRVLVSTPYFVPPRELLYALCSTAERGVRVVVLLSEWCDSRVVGAASRAYIPKLLRSGVEVWLYGRGFNHAKCLVVDDVAIVGSANFDYRSMRRNLEAMVVVRGGECLSALCEDFCSALADSRRVSAEEWRSRPLSCRVVEMLTLPLRRLL